MQLKTPVKIALFSYKEIFLIAFCMLFLFQFVSKLGKCVFYMPKSPFSCLLFHIKVFSKIFKRLYFPQKKTKKVKLCF